MDVLETYPRDELFQTPVPELAAIVEKVAHLKERRQVRMFVRRDPYGRYLSCLIYLPRDRYTTAVRRRMEDILMVLSAEPRSSTRRALPSPCSRGSTWWCGCPSARPWARSTCAPWSVS